MNDFYKWCDFCGMGWDELTYNPNINYKVLLENAMKEYKPMKKTIKEVSYEMVSTCDTLIGFYATMNTLGGGYEDKIIDATSTGIALTIFAELDEATLQKFVDDKTPMAGAVQELLNVYRNQ